MPFPRTWQRSKPSWRKYRRPTPGPDLFAREEDTIYIPEISANKYALMIRFTSMAPAAEGGAAAQRPRQTEANVSFELTYCNL